MWEVWETLTEEEEACFLEVENEDIWCTFEGYQARLANMKEAKEYRQTHQREERRAAEDDAKSIMESALSIAKNINFNAKLTDPPLTFIKDLLQKYFDIQHNKNKFYAMYPHMLKDASEIFKIEQIQAAIHPSGSF